MDVDDLSIFNDIEMNDNDDFKAELDEIDEEELLNDDKNRMKNKNEKTKQNVSNQNKCEIEVGVASKHETLNEYCPPLDVKKTSHSSERLQLRDNYLDYRRLYKTLNVDKTTDKSIVGIEIAHRLQERKTHLVKHVVRVLGVDLTVEIFEETKKVLKQGGLKTDIGNRKRTPGGVFFYLMKNRYASKEQYKNIFKEEEITKKKNKHRVKLLKRQQTEKNMANLVNRQKEDLKS